MSRNKTKEITKQLLDYTDTDELLEYMNSLKDSIEEENETEKTLNIVLNNILTKYDNFNDPRHLRSSNIMAINGLLKTKKEIHDTLIGHKKDLLNLILKKRESDSKNKTMLEISDKDTSANIDFKTLLLQLDNLNIYPVVSKEDLAKAESLIDTQNAEILGDKEEENIEEGCGEQNT